MCICLLRFIGQEGIARGDGELQNMEHGVEHGAAEDAREEREASVGGHGGEHHARDHHQGRQCLAAAAQE